MTATSYPSILKKEGENPSELRSEFDRPFGPAKKIKNMLYTPKSMSILTTLSHISKSSFFKIFLKKGNKVNQEFD
jgi:hypothetical protein